jgi:hypothetical protein
MSTEPAAADPNPAGWQQPSEDSTPDDETQRILRRLRKKPPQQSFRVLVWDALLGIALGVLVVTLFSLMFKPFQWLTAGVTGH